MRLEQFLHLSHILVRKDEHRSHADLLDLLEKIDGPRGILPYQRGRRGGCWFPLGTTQRLAVEVPIEYEEGYLAEVSQARGFQKLGHRHYMAPGRFDLRLELMDAGPSVLNLIVDKDCDAVEE